jgi:hypothetical protein
MNTISQAISKLLRERGIQHKAHGNKLRIPLASGFGEIEFAELDDGDTILGLVNHEWHTHGELLIPDYGDDIPSAIVSFFGAILSGKLKMIEYQLPGEDPKRIIEDDIETFLKYKQPCEKVRVFEPNSSTEPGA